MQILVNCLFVTILFLFRIGKYNCFVTFYTKKYSNKTEIAMITLSSFLIYYLMHNMLKRQAISFGPCNVMLA